MPNESKSPKFGSRGLGLALPPTSADHFAFRARLEKLCEAHRTCSGDRLVVAI